LGPSVDQTSDPTTTDLRKVTEESEAGLTGAAPSIVQGSAVSATVGLIGAMAVLTFLLTGGTFFWRRSDRNQHELSERSNAEEVDSHSDLDPAQIIAAVNGKDNTIGASRPHCATSGASRFNWRLKGEYRVCVQDIPSILQSDSFS
jgi:hypothetical protein